MMSMPSWQPWKNILNRSRASFVRQKAAKDLVVLDGLQGTSLFGYQLEPAE
jgi:hypothetical protein